MATVRMSEKPRTNRTRKVMVIDDLESTCRLVKTLIEQHWSSFEVSTCTESIQAIEMIRAVRPEVILLDIQMPGIPGGDIAQRLSEDSKLKKIPIIFLTGMLTHDEARSRANTACGEHFLAKPIIASELIATVEKYME